MAQLSSQINQSFNNLLINGAMQYAQRPGDLGTTTNISSSSYVIDRWRYGAGLGSGTVDISHVLGGPSFTESGYVSDKMQRIDVNTVQASIGAGDAADITQRIEGRTISEAQANDKEFLFLFWARTNIPLNLTVQVLAYDSVGSITHSFVIPFTTSTTLTRHAFLIDKPLVSLHGAEVASLSAGISLASGTTFHTASPNQWNAGVFTGTSAQDNFYSSASNFIEFTQVCLVARERFNEDFRDQFIYVPHSKEKDGELAACFLYYQKSWGLDLPATTAGAAAGSNQWTHNSPGNLRWHFWLDYPMRRASGATAIPYDPITPAVGRVWGNSSIVSSAFQLGHTEIGINSGAGWPGIGTGIDFRYGYTVEDEI